MSCSFVQAPVHPFAHPLSAQSRQGRGQIDLLTFSAKRCLIMVIVHRILVDLACVLVALFIGNVLFIMLLAGGAVFRMIFREQANSRQETWARITRYAKRSKRIALILWFAILLLAILAGILQ